jgi:hypothetical protein
MVYYELLIILINYYCYNGTYLCFLSDQMKEKYILLLTERRNIIW